MARYVRYKRYYKKIYPRKRWASHVKSDRPYITITPDGASGSTSFVVCKNSASDANPTPSILKFGRFKMKGDIRTLAANAGNATSCNVFVVYVPEGATLDALLIDRHPEYILGWSCLSLDTGNSFSITSSLKRNLNSGDSIQAFFTADVSHYPESSITYNFFYTIQYWTSTA